MGWTLRKIDSLIGTVIAACSGLAASQAQAFIHQYLQRLGGHLDEATLMQQRFASSAKNEALVKAATERIQELSQSHDAITSADVLSRPFVFARHMDMDITLATSQSFTPSLPLEAQSLAYGLIGIVAGWLVYELVKAPFGFRSGESERRLVR